MRQHAAERPHRPLFLWLSLNAPHTPMQAPEAAVARFPASYPPETRTYLAMVESMDAAFGVAVEALRDTRMLPRALVLFLADNGGPMIPPACNGGLRGGKGTPFEGGVRAPAFVHWPSCLGRQPRRSSAPAHTSLGPAVVSFVCRANVCRTKTYRNCVIVSLPSRAVGESC